MTQVTKVSLVSVFLCVCYLVLDKYISVFFFLETTRS